MGADGAEEPECTGVHEDSEHRPRPPDGCAAVLTAALITRQSYAKFKPQPANSFAYRDSRDAVSRCGSGIGWRISQQIAADKVVAVVLVLSKAGVCCKVDIGRSAVWAAERIHIAIGRPIRCQRKPFFQCMQLLGVRLCQCGRTAGNVVLHRDGVPAGFRVEIARVAEAGVVGTDQERTFAVVAFTGKQYVAAVTSPLKCRPLAKSPLPASAVLLTLAPGRKNG